MRANQCLAEAHHAALFPVATGTDFQQVAVCDLVLATAQQADHRLQRLRWRFRWPAFDDGEFTGIGQANTPKRLCGP